MRREDPQGSAKRARATAKRTRLCLVMMAWLLASGHAGADEVDGIAAIVGEDVILRSEVSSTAAQMLAQVQAQQGSVTPQMAREARQQALSSLIDDRLILKIAERNDMNASDPEIDQAIEGIASDEGVSVEDVYAAVQAQGISREAYRTQLGRQMTKMRVVQGSVQSRVSVSDEEVELLFRKRYGNVSPGERLRVLHILLPWPPDATPEIRTQLIQAAKGVREQAIESSDFASLARRYSAAPTASNGGLTAFRPGEAPPAIESALAQLGPGEISPIVETAYGLNLFQLIDRFDPSTIRLEDVQEQLRFELQDMKSGPELEKWLVELRETQYIEIVEAP